ncbi:MAG: retron St85 family RNA-directed DNA polymerase [Bacteroidales bacterium]|jgi:hypothetical protein|nr:retron St85 family RNA-directed DNA polymerase [Bacteroidales bacterium]
MESSQIIKKWESFYTDRGLEKELSDKYIKYITPLIEKDVPVIFNFTHLAKLLRRKNDYLASVVNSTSNHYREFKLKKRSGGFRNINAPYSALLEMQYWIYKNVLLKIPVHYCSHGFTKKKSIITNAKLHLNQNQLLKLDLSNFFPSIHLARVIKVFKSLGYTTNVSFYLASICCLNESLPQGAPTSPYLSNIIACDLDNRLIRFSKKFNLRYTRYADDLTFSGENISVKHIEYISKIVKEEGFNVNSNKTRLYKDGGRRIVTGISVADKVLKVPREYKRKLKQEIYYIEKYGLVSHIKKQKIKTPYYIESIIGKLNYWRSVEPNSEYVKNKLEILKKMLSTNHNTRS